jgi:excisionase family DNA binding protein|tara:strand:+ start:283 stop:630 length:348 start_codon:yes stop_codon:yes gene_type:complete
MMNDKLVYTTEEVAELLQVSTSTVERLVQGGYLPRLQGIKNIRIPVSGVHQYVDGYNSDSAEGIVSQTGGKRCLSGKEKKVSGSEVIAHIGGLPSSTQAVRELRSRLEPRTNAKR